MRYRYTHDDQRALVEERLGFTLPCTIVSRAASLIYPGDRYLEKFFDTQSFDSRTFRDAVIWEEYIVLSTERLGGGEWRVTAASTEDGSIETKIVNVDVDRFYILEKTKASSIPPTRKSSLPPNNV